MREYSVPVLVDVPESANLAETVFRRAQEQPDAVVLRRKDGDAWPEVSAARFRDEVAAVAKGLIAAGIGPGDRVALMSRTRYEWTLVDYAIWAAGAVTVPIYETSSAEQVRWILTDSGAKAAFVELDDHAKTVAEAVPELKNVWRVDESLDGSGVSDDELHARRAALKAADLATIVYTSGTTGRPKGCRITHDNLLFVALNVVKGPLAPLFSGPGVSALLFLPLAHIFARVIQVVFVETGAVLGHTPNMKNVAPDLASFQPSFLLGVPRVFEKVYNGAEQKATADGKGRIFAKAASVAVSYSRTGSPKFLHWIFDRLVYGKLRAATGGRLTAAVSGGSALGERLGHFFRGVGIEVFEGYGLTETTAPISVNMPGGNKVGTVGRPLPGTSVRIADDGEVLARGRHIFDGYWNNPEATAQALSDGWYATGDVGELDGDGYLRITGRKKEILVTAAGKNVAPGPLEDIVRASPIVSQAMVVGENRPFVAVLVTLDPEALAQVRLTQEQIQAEVQKAVDAANATVSRPEQIKKFVVLESDLTEESGHLTPTLKVKRNLVMRDFAGEIDALYGG
ncbi:AMP-dependent synthetase/ligase [Nonomuraea soli]|uniref:Acyl-CoA synthetase n=1 Tax=Nonomuraea soli TaxID=1032476 RepID=A0A7W0HNG3_9ACTN|nr:AMP-dependent synthetase/ligase [Nonomuraea soli]MBA2889511.1 long-chain acyl-CoA synthetase [Nonomuraea soli]